MAPDAALARAVAQALTGTPGVISVYLFGSTAAGRPHRDSDVDVALLLDWGLYPDRRARFEARLRAHARLGPALGRDDLDIVVLNDAPPLFARAIVTTGHRVVSAEPETDRAFRRDTLLRAADLAPFLARARRRLLHALGAAPARPA
ncbi:MAG: nucleotidyltransferase domain-containing protein [Acidobacteria bacterium]|nr:nucleotidyltransferase domain-containing protein [Acidobacteriota bacterium]